MSTDPWGVQNLRSPETARRRRGIPRSPRLWISMVVALLAIVGLDLLLNGGRNGTAAQAPDLASWELQSLREEAELAGTDRFYLVLDLADSVLTLRYDGTILQQYSVLQTMVGSPRGLFSGSASGYGHLAGAWRDGAMLPPRHAGGTVETAPAIGDSTAKPVIIPPTPEEAYPAPTRWRVRFANGAELEIVGADDGGAAGEPPLAWLGRQWRELTDAAGRRAAPRLRLLLPAEDADRLYRGLPPDPCLLVRVS